MKKVLVLLALAAFIIYVPLALAADQPGMGAPAKAGSDPAKSINCCVKGKCDQVKSEADCTKAGGKVVKDCKECK